MTLHGPARLVVIGFVILAAGSLLQASWKHSALYRPHHTSDSATPESGVVPPQTSLPARKLTILHAFTGGADGGHPTARLLQSNGNLYGAAADFGSSSAGTLFKINQQGKLHVIYDFKGGTDGARPTAGLIRDKVGNFYGITDSGGASDFGTVFKLNKSGVKTVIYNFRGGTADGQFPQGPLLSSENGKFYGVTFTGGSSACSGQGCGVVFSLTKAGKERMLYRFAGASDGANPVGPLIEDARGNMYGATAYGGENSCGPGCGTIFKISKTGKLTTIYRFRGAPDGAQPYAGLITDAQGDLFGTTFFGGTNNLGTVFKLARTGTESIIYSFCIDGGHCSDGTNPNASLIADANGHLFGTAAYGGSGGTCMFGCGTVFELDQSGMQTVLHSFVGGKDGARPFASLTIDAAGNLYGATNEGGPSNVGVVFKITP